MDELAKNENIIKFADEYKKIIGYDEENHWVAGKMEEGWEERVEDLIKKMQSLSSDNDTEKDENVKAFQNTIKRRLKIIKIIFLWLFMR